MTLPFASTSDFALSISGYELDRRPTISGWATSSGETSETTAQIAVSGAVVDRRTSRSTGPAAITGAERGFVVYDRPSGSLSVISVKGGKNAAAWLGPSPPTIAVFGGS